MCLYGDCYDGRGLVRDCDARIKAMIAELQESIDFNS